MGEIAEALRRANADRASRDRSSSPPLDTPQAPPPVEGSSEPTVPNVPGALAGGASSAGARQPAAAAQERREISLERSGAWVARSVLIDRKGGVAEAYRHFAIRVGNALEMRGDRSLIITSALRLEGKTTTSCNLALALASIAGGRQTALVDLDLRRPSVGSYLDIRPSVGIDGVLRGDVDLAEARIPTNLPSLDLYPVACHVNEPHELLAGARLPALLHELSLSYDTIVVDSPPLLLVPDAQLIAPHVGCCVAVLRAGQTRKEAFKQAIEMIPPGKLIGTFLNDARRPRHSEQYSYYLDDDALPEEAR